jgi:hypothetical protein
VEKEEKSKQKEVMIEEEEEKIDTGLDSSVQLLIEYHDRILPRKETYHMLLGEAKQAAESAGDKFDEKVLLESGLDFTMVPQQFEKDIDENYHVDYIYSMSNLRALNYGLEEMDWITTKIKAGRIIPALATTTAAVAGLQTIELLKIIKQSELVDFRSTNINLAVPFLMCSEPGAPKKTTLKEGLVVDIWDVWTIEATSNDSLKSLLTKIEEKYGLKPQDVFYESKPIYLRAIESMAKEDKTDKSLTDLLKLTPDMLSVELTVTFILPEEENGSKCLEGVPPIIIELKKPEG